MTRLPESRRVIAGRTWSRSWSPADSDPIQAYRRTGSRLADCLFATAIGVILAVLIIHWIAR